MIDNEDGAAFSRHQFLIMQGDPGPGQGGEKFKSQSGGFVSERIHHLVS